MSLWRVLIRVVVEGARNSFPVGYAAVGAGLVVLARTAGWAGLEPWGILLLVPVIGWAAFIVVCCPALLCYGFLRSRGRRTWRGW